jgi:ubiquitin-like protein Nedd8
MPEIISIDKNILCLVNKDTTIEKFQRKVSEYYKNKNRTLTAIFLGFGSQTSVDSYKNMGQIFDLFERSKNLSVNSKNYLLGFDTFCNYVPSGCTYGSEKIQIRTLTGKIFEVSYSKDMLVYDIELLIEEKQGIPPHQQKLIFNGKFLDPSKSVSFYGLKETDIMHLVLALRGGMFLSITSGCVDYEKIENKVIEIDCTD